MIKRESIDEILTACRIEEVVGDFVRLQKRGVNYIGLCPFHTEKTPSFTVSPAKGIFKCFGCGEAGDSVGFIIKHEHYSYVEAIRYLAKKYNIQIEETAQTTEEIQRINERESLFAVTAFASEFFSKMLYEHEEGKSIGLAYFKERGFSEESMTKFALGYSLKQRDALYKHALKQGYTQENLEKAGLIIVKENQGGDYVFDRFTERVIFPIHNFSGKIIAFGGRILGNVDKHNAKYINSPETSIYHKSDVLYGIFQAKNAIKKEDKCYLVEGYTDVISLHQSGIENVVASSGTSLTTGQIKLLNKLTDNISIVYDGDKAGIHAALRAVGMLLKENLNIRVIVLPPDDDPDSFARSNDTNAIRDYFHENEQDFLGFKISLLLKDVEKDPVKRADFINQIAADIALIPDIIKVSIFVKQCSALMQIEENILYRAVNKIRIKNYKKEKEKQTIDQNNLPEISKPDSTKQVIIESTPLSLVDVEKRILTLLVNYGNQSLYLPNEDSMSKEKTIETRVDQFIFDNLKSDELSFETPLYQKFFNVYVELIEENPIDISNKLQHNPDVEINKLYFSLVEINPTPSPLWESSKIKSFINTIYNNAEKLHEEVVRTLQMLRLIKLTAIKSNYEKMLKLANSEDESLMYLSKISEINTIICEIEKVLGVTYR
ncbi:MAG: DNA primase [Bacteroidales bacterium]|jgi:DNA primase|nr:DNA primase [Bacteroidales bacterium]MDD3329794.1 DNA primase [Bacteroidales bacterium]MDD3690595.1 DNA primase [Bacteroidales bacterium]MDD4044039.1 DNA primase [Bacteroidales bacterium]MDD4581112.1 DNA primase [Bacteroidales bacterium]